MKLVGSVADVTYHTFWVRVDDNDAVQIHAAGHVFCH